MSECDKHDDKSYDNRIADPHSPQIKARLYLKVLTAHWASVRHIKHTFAGIRTVMYEQIALHTFRTFAVHDTIELGALLYYRH